MNPYLIAAYIAIGICVIVLLVILASLILSNRPVDTKHPPRPKKEAQRKTEKYSSQPQQYSFASYWDKPPDARQQRGHLKKSKWSQIRKTQKDEARRRS